jgi:hypothetical protein
VEQRSLGSTDPAGWLFLAIGVAADSAALLLLSVQLGGVPLMIAGRKHQ